MIVLWLAAINAVTFLAFWEDKRRAVRGEWRISERMLLTVAAMGGSPAALLAQTLLRHKTRKEPFRTRLLVIASVQAAALAAVVILR